MEKLIRDVSENGSTTRGDAPFGDEDEKAGEKLLQVHGGAGFVELAKKFPREVVGVGGSAEASGVVKTQVTETKAAVQGQKTTLATMDGVMTTARWIRGFGCGEL